MVTFGDLIMPVPDDRKVTDLIQQPSKHGKLPNADSMLAHRLRRWRNIESALGECPVFAGKHQTVTRWRMNVKPTLGERLMFAEMLAYEDKQQ